MVRFGVVTRKGKVVCTTATILWRMWTIVDYGCAIPGAREAPINDVFADDIAERSRCGATHLASGDLYMRTGPNDVPIQPHVTEGPRAVRWAQYHKAKECEGNTWTSRGGDPLVLEELRAHTHDALRTSRVRDHMSSICIAPEALPKHNVCAIRVVPSFRFTHRAIIPHITTSAWVCLMSHNERIRLAAPWCLANVEELSRSTQASAHPSGLGPLLELEPNGVTIANKCMPMPMSPLSDPMGQVAHGRRRRNSGEIYAAYRPRLREFPISKPR